MNINKISNMYTKKISIVSLALLSMCTSTYSETLTNAKDKVVKVNNELKNPLGCKDLGYEFKLKILKLLPAETGDHQSLYFILNRRAQSVNLYQMRQSESVRSMYLNHVIRPGQWAALSTGEPSVNYICTIDDPHWRYGKIVDCADSLQVCEYARVKYGMNNRGNFWVVNSNSRGGAVQEVLRYGIIPR